MLIAAGRLCSAYVCLETSIRAVLSDCILLTSSPALHSNTLNRGWVNIRDSVLIKARLFSFAYTCLVCDGILLTASQTLPSNILNRGRVNTRDTSMQEARLFSIHVSRLLFCVVRDCILLATSQSFTSNILYERVFVLSNKTRASSVLHDSRSYSSSPLSDCVFLAAFQNLASHPESCCAPCT